MELSEPQSALYNWRKNPGAEVTLVGPGEKGFRPNRFGVLHASGNAREWTQSAFRRYGSDHPYRDDDRNADDLGFRVAGSRPSSGPARLTDRIRSFNPGVPT